MNINNSKNIEHVRQAALLLDKENQKLVRENARLKEENRFLKGDASEQKQRDLVGVEDAPRKSAKEDEQRTKPKSASERRNGREKESSTSKEPQRGHVPTEQPNLPIVESTYHLDEADMVCPECGVGLRLSANHDVKRQVSVVVSAT